MDNFVFFNIILLVTIACVSFFLGGIVYMHNRKLPVNIFFASTSVFAGGWTLVTVLRYWYLTVYGQPPLFFTNLSLVLALGTFFFFLLFVYSLRTNYLELSRKKLYLVSSIFVLVVVLSFASDVMVNGEVFTTSTIQPAFYWGLGYYFLYMPTLGFFYLWGLWYSFVLYRSEKEERAEEKQRYLYVFLSSAIGGMVGFGFGSLLPLIPSLVEFFWIGRIGVFIFIFFTAYAILKYRLFDIKFIAVEASIITLSFFLLGDIFFSDTVNEQIVSGSLFVLTVVLGFFLSRAVRKEIEQRERLEKVTANIQSVNKDLELLDQQKTEFVSLASHQLRTPLTAVKGYTSMLLEGSFGELEGDAKKAVNDIYEESETLSQAVENLLVVSRIEQGRIQYTFERVDFLKLVDDVFQDIKKKVDGEKLQVTFDSTGENFGFVYADKQKLKQALMSLVRNAISHTEKGYVRLMLKRDQMNGVMRFSVSDTGEGFTKEEISHVFEGFRDVELKEENISHDFQSGMSLYITHEFIKAHRGKIWIESAGKGQGSSFFVELPFYRQTVLADQTETSSIS